MQITETFLNEVENVIKNYVHSKRLTHTLSVEKEAFNLGKIFGLDENTLNKLKLAGLLHDITKELSTSDQINLCQKYGYNISIDDLNSPKVFHSITGAYLAKELFKNEVDDEIFNAIRFHTTGKENMTLFEKIIYLADYIEELRTFPDCIELRNLFYSNENIDESHLNKILLISFDMTLKNLIADNSHIHMVTIKARNYLLNEEKINA